MFWVRSRCSKGRAACRSDKRCLVGGVRTSRGLNGGAELIARELDVISVAVLLMVLMLEPQSSKNLPSCISRHIFASMVSCAPTV